MLHLLFLGVRSMSDEGKEGFERIENKKVIY